MRSTSFATLARRFQAGLLALIVLALLAGNTGRAAASPDDTVDELFQATDLAVAVTEHMQWYWDEIFRQSDIRAETPYALLFDMYSYGATGCGDVANYDYSFYCVGDDTVYVNIDHVQDMREDYGDLYAAVLGVGQP